MSNIIPKVSLLLVLQTHCEFYTYQAAVVLGSIHTERHATSYARELYLSQVWFKFWSMVLFTQVASLGMGSMPNLAASNT